MTNKELFEAFAKEMRINNWTVEQIAEEMNICPATFYNWQRGKISNRGRRAMLTYLVRSHAIEDIGDVKITAPNNSGTVIGKNVGNGAPVDFSAAIRKIMASDRLTDAEKLKVIDVLNN